MTFALLRRATEAPDPLELLDNWQAIVAAADSGVVPIQTSYLHWIKELHRAVTTEELEKMIAQGFDPENVTRWVDKVEFSFDLFRSTLELVATLAGSQAIKDLVAAFPDRAGLQVKFDIQNPLVKDFLDAHLPDLVGGIRKETKAAVRDIVMRAFREGRHPYEQAEEIKRIVGLLPRHAIAVQNLRRSLEEQGAGPERVKQLTDAYAKKLILYRARNIARTETILAANAGQHAAWLESVDEGLLELERTKRRWIVTPDDRLCENICAPMDGQQRGMHSPFMTGAGYTVMYPPSHPSCRCALGLVFVPPGERWPDETSPKPKPPKPTPPPKIVTPPKAEKPPKVVKPKPVAPPKDLSGAEARAAIEKLAGGTSGKLAELDADHQRYLEEHRVLLAQYNRLRGPSTAMQRSELGNQIYAVSVKMRAAQKAYAAALDGVQGEIRSKFLYQPGGAVAGFNPEIRDGRLRADTKLVGKYNADFSELQRLVSPKLLAGKFVEVVPEYTSARSFYRDNTLHMSPKNGPGTLAHEFGHWLEEAGPGVHQKVLDYYNKRTAGEIPVSLKKLTGLSFDDHEMARQDKFINPYSGKLYPSMRHTELLSMGLEQYFMDPLMLIAKDPAMFDFVYDTLRGN